jgi:1,4-dihydroxy-2-naphthoate octaprenyltransferase
MSAKVFVIRTVIALMAVLSFAVHNWTGFEPLKWLGLIFWVIAYLYGYPQYVVVSQLY